MKWKLLAAAAVGAFMALTPYATAPPEQYLVQTSAAEKQAVALKEVATVPRSTVTLADQSIVAHFAVPNATIVNATISGAQWAGRTPAAHSENAPVTGKSLETLATNI